MRSVKNTKNKNAPRGAKRKRRKSKMAKQCLENRIVNRADIILIALLVLLPISVFIIFGFFRPDGAAVRIYVDGEMTQEISLKDAGEYPIGDGNVIVIESGRVYMKHADCPDGLCKRQGEISRTGERIVCLPNRVIVEIIGSGEEVIGV